MNLAPIVIAVIQLMQNQASEPGLRIQPTISNPGETVTLSWRKLQAKSAYITDLGEVSTEGGNEKLRLEESRTFLLVVERLSGEVSVSSHQVLVRGNKGASQPWQDPFTLHVDFEQTFEARTPLAVLLRRIKSVLQEDESLQLREISAPPNEIIIYSPFTESPHLFKDARKVWRLLYKVTIKLAQPRHQVTVAAAIQWRPLIDSRWFNGDAGAGDAIRAHIVNLRNRMEATH